ncbi:MAG: class B sortase [Mollicutes bacterium]|nr:class B sortase [Mollicutes bacterium]
MKKTKIIVNLLLMIFIIGLIFSVYKIITWQKDNKAINRQLENINKSVKINEVEDNNNAEIIEQQEEIPKSNPYWDYIKMNLIDVDFNELKKTNKEVKGWIQVNGTNINYPFVQTTNNEYYLTRAFNKSYNDAGWIFLDYRNNIETLDKNTIIYGHSRLDQTMFGTLKNITKNNWYNDSNNYIIKLSTQAHNTLWQVFSVYIIETTSDYLKISFDSGTEFLNFAKMLMNRSKFDFNTSINENDRIVTLSTCYNDNKKVVMHAKLIKIENKNT